MGRVGQLRSAALLGTIILVLAGGYLLGRDAGGPTGRLAGQVGPSGVLTGQGGPTSTAAAPPGSPSPIYSAQEAIALSLSRFPPGHNPHAAEARLLRTQTMDADWLLVDQSDSDAGPDSPVWLVGILGDGLAVDDTVDLPSLPEDILPRDDTPVTGVWYAWDTNSGQLFAQGALDDADWRSYAALTALANESLPIQPATPSPTETPSVPAAP